MAKERLKYQGFGTIQGVKRVLWRILCQVKEHLDNPDTADEVKHRWANTGIQAALAYSKLEETHQLSDDVRALERLSATNGHQA